MSMGMVIDLLHKTFAAPSFVGDWIGALFSQRIYHLCYETIQTLMLMLTTMQYFHFDDSTL